ncbi:NosD domain-containing protein [Flavitalea flava]
MKIPLHNRFLLYLIGAIAFPVLMLMPAKSRGQGSSMTFVVNVMGDEADPDADNFSDGHCDVDPNTPGDQCTLRAAIQNHNANRNLPQNQINFAILNAPGSGSIVIKVGSTGLGPLPPILGSVIITALNNDPGQGGSSRHIEIDGSAAGGNAIGLQLLGGQCVISFFIINSFSSHGIYIAGTPPPGDGGHQLEGNYIGTDSTGSVDKGNGGDGIFIDNTPGNTIGGKGIRLNIISANKGYGIHIAGKDSSVTGQANGGTNNLAKGNIIGLDRSTQKLLPNGLDAVILEDAPNNSIGGSGQNDGNTIGGTKNGVTVSGNFSEGIKIQGNFIGLDGTGAKFTAGIFARGGKQLSVEGNILTNIDGVGVDLFLDASGNYRLLKNRFDGDMKVGSKFRFGPGRTIDISYQNNFHTNNGLAFDVQESVSGNINWIVAGDTIRAGQAGANIIFSAAGNKNFTANRWEGNAGVGFAFAANIAPGVQAKLIQTSEVFANNTQGGVSGKINAGGELSITMADITGTGNGKDGCSLNFVVGGGASVILNSTGNKYSLNGFAGLRLVGDGLNADLVQVFIEKDIFDHNILAGINLLNMKLRHSIDNSTITNNGGPGIELEGISDVRIDGNTIASNSVGILINDAATGSISSNTITGNGQGIALAGSGTGITISGNSIFGNTGLGIDLGNDGVTPNHVGGPIPGPNNFQNHPVLTSANMKGPDFMIKGTLNSAANALFRVEFFSNTACNASGFGDGETFLGFKLLTTDATGNIAFSDTITGASISGNSVITSIATDSTGNSSEFSGCIQSIVLPLQLISFTATANTGTVTLNWNTSGEMNTRYFSVQRSEDGLIFNQLGQVPAAGRSALPQSYSFIDRQPLQSVNYYRLRMVDLDSAFTYSKIIAAMKGPYLNNLSLYPDPASNEIKIRLSAGGLFNFKLTDGSGRIVREGVLHSIRNDATILDISDLPANVYILIIQDSGKILYRKFIKQ